MELEEYEIMFQAEDRHWWYLGMAAITKGMLDRYICRGKNLSILDAGCGTGATLDYLRDYGTPTGIDFSPEAVRFCRGRNLDRVCQASSHGRVGRGSPMSIIAEAVQSRFNERNRIEHGDPALT